ncbi:ubiquitin-conjugating enzyme E2Q-like protein 1 [Sceloporus undulatus]|uniref:ubiquitin-conjugating enzyme E2Q-like protein 1 n=1 Tax=Sceloporus undulatus TaxID=8520 RepID=UPI001C4B4081|nr:ubiquitin-conjugating enzyme E2Q-like protein 1 [Sceloporus undulatus]
MATLLRKIGLIRLHNRDTEDPKHHHHHHHHRGSSQQGSSSLRGKSHPKSKPQGSSPSKESHCSSSASPARHKPPKQQPPAPQPQAAPEEKKGPPAGSKEAPSGGKAVPPSRQAHCTQVRTRRLMKELQDIARLSDRFISVELVDESLFDWNVKLHQVDKDSVLWQDMKETSTEYILLNLTFPDNFPFAPPFMRVLSPRLENGYVLDGGAICMELLTPRGWSSAYTVEAVMRQFAASLVKGQGRICRKAGKSKKSFSRKEAEATFKSLVKTHEKYGWVTPPVSDG